MKRTLLITSLLVSALLLPTACDDDGDGGGGNDGSAGGSGGVIGAGSDAAAGTGGTANGGSGGSALAGAGGAAGSGGTPNSAGIPAPKTATVVVATAVEPLTATTYELPKTGKFAGQRNNDEFFANFDGSPDFGSQFGGDSISLRFSGFFKTGTFACGARAKPNDEYAIQTNVELWTFVNAKSQLTQFRGLNAGSTCSITVTTLDATSIKGTYTAKLFADATKFVTISGAFHATAN